ncbi:hypothetical protein ACPCSP_01955 [Streptomyces cinereoruber]|uniref:hypothetical protein n=1 Tax=Streptomyces cinereoruber TaxID=67260 RepID=UPI003C2F5435
MPLSPNSGATIRGEKTELPKPIRRVPDIPDADLHKDLRAALKKHGMSDRAAGAISTIWTNPAAVLPQVENPQRRRIPGADLLIISGQVYTARLSPDPLNPRNADQVHFALAGSSDGAPPALLTPAVEEGVGEMSIRVASRDDLAKQLAWAIEATRNQNLPNPEIADQGIMDPPIGVATTVYYEADGEGPTTHIFVREGSTRTSHGLYYIGVTADDVLFTLPRGAAPMQSHIDKINSYADKPKKAILFTEQAAVRCAVTDFELIIGVVPDEAGAVDLSQAIKARVAQDHLNTKMPWSDAAKYTSLAEECLLAARAAEVLQSDAEADWLAGRLTQEQASNHKIPAFLDDRAARTVHLFTTRDQKIHDAVRKPIALVLAGGEPPKGQRRKNVTLKTKLPLGVEMIARELRGKSSDVDLAAFRKTLESALPGHLNQPNAWKPTRRTPEALYQAAVKELENSEIGGPAGTELWVRGAYVLVKHKAISGQRHDIAGGDRRPPAEVMRELLETDLGLRHLRQAIEDDRAGLRPRRVDAQGYPEQSAAGKDLHIDNKFLREMLAPKEKEEQPPLDEDAILDEKYRRALKDTQGALRMLADAMRNLGGLEDDNGVPLIEQRGRSEAKLLRGTLQHLLSTAEEWWEAAVEAGPASVDDDEMSNEDGAEDEGA